MDLAHTSYANVGIVLLERLSGRHQARAIKGRELDLVGNPSEKALADCLSDHCGRLGVAALLMDGPQGWKRPDNGLAHSRICERTLNTPGKTGLPGFTKPANYAPFIAFSVSVFDRLAQKGLTLFGGPSGSLPATTLLAESFPLAAWRALQLKPLPAKAKAQPHDLAAASRALQEVFDIAVPPALTHDEMQALVSGMAGFAMAGARQDGYSMAGEIPSMLDNSWREGFIVNPTRRALM